jgi:hypothetical protein
MWEMVLVCTALQYCFPHEVIVKGAYFTEHSCEKAIAEDVWNWLPVWGNLWYDCKPMGGISV